jgi:hypothetical protein
MPAEITDRNADVWESLLSIADAAGGIWPDRARVSAVTLVTSAQAGGPSLGLRLLADARTVFGDHNVLPTSFFLSTLIELEESVWGDLKGKPLDARRLAALLRPYEITSKVVRIEDGTHRGYAKQDFYDAWARYLPTTDSGDVGPPAQVHVTSVTNETPDLFPGVDLAD